MKQIIRFTLGDIDKIVVSEGNSVITLEVWEHGEEDPLIVGELDVEGLENLVNALKLAKSDKLKRKG